MAARPDLLPPIVLRAGAAVVLALAWLALAAGPAGAHPAVATSSPTDGAVLERSPAEVSITFGEGVEAPLGSVKVYDRDSERVDLDDARLVGADARTAQVTLRPDLPDGTYVVIWRAVGLDDGHLVIGQQHFTVGAAGGDPAVVVDAPDGGGEVLGALTATTAAASTAATVVALGGAVVAIGLVRRRDGRWRPARLALTRTVHVAAVVGCAANVALVLLQTAERVALLGTGPTASLAATVVAPAGAAAIARALLLLPIATRTLLGVRWYVLGATLVATASLALDGHVDGLASAAAVVHVLVAALWGGGLVGLVVAVRHAPDDDADGTATLLGRFSGLAAVAVVVAGLAGAVVALAATGGSFDAATSSPWGRLLSTKTVLVAAALLIAAHTRTVVMPALRRTVAAVPQGGSVDVAAAPTTTATDLRRERELRRNLVLEVLLVGAALVASGALGTFAPPAAAVPLPDDDCPPAAAAGDGVEHAHPCEDDEVGAT